MKISSASKKVLASALSAAMVVAFAPTAAFGTIAEGTNSVTVTFDVNGGTVADTTVSDSHTGVVNTAKASVDANGKLTISDIAAYAAVAEKADAAIDHWFYDANGDGVDTSAVEGDTSGDLVYGVAGIDTTTLAKDTTAITLKAAYAVPAIADNDAVLNFTPGAAEETIDTATVKVTNLNAKYQYYATLTLPDGTVLTSDVAAKGTEATFTFTAKLTDAQKKLAKGTYKYAVYKNGAADAVVTKDIDIYQVTLTAGAGYGTYQAGDKTSYLVKKGTTYATLYGLSLTAPTSEAGSYNFVQYVDANGIAVTSTAGTKVTSDLALTAVYDNLQVSDVKIDTVANTLKFKAIGKFAALGEDGQYNATVTGPNGFSKVLKNVVVNTAAATAVDSGTLTFALTDYETATGVTTKLEAGEYTVAIAPVAKEGKTLTNAQSSQVIASASATLAAVTYDLDGGSWIPGADGKDQAQVKALITLAQVGDPITAINTKATAAQGNTILKAPELKSFKEWTYNGKVAAKADNVSASGVTVKAVWQDANIAAPEVSIAASGDKYVMTVTGAADTAVKYGIGTTDAVAATKTLAAGATITVDPTKDFYVAIKAESTKNNLVSETVKYASYAKYTTAVGNEMTNIMNTSTSTSAANKPVRYGDTLTTLKSDAEAAVKAVGFQSTKDWTKTVASIEKDALDKVAAIEKANAVALQTLTKGADGKYTYITAATADTATSTIDAVIADYIGFTGKDKDSYKQTSKEVGTLTKTSTYADYITSIKKAVANAKDAKVTVATADAEAAIAASEALKAATTGEAAQAALAAYAALTDTQKQLVPAADVAAAQAVAVKAAEEKAAQELVDAQDEGTLNKISTTKKLTFTAKKAKTTKARYITYATKVSKSGNAVVYAKASGSSKITVAASGKVTLKKGAAKGKTYTAKVTATCGTQSRTVNVKFIVK